MKYTNLIMLNTGPKAITFYISLLFFLVHLFAYSVVYNELFS